MFRGPRSGAKVCFSVRLGANALGDPKSKGTGPEFEGGGRPKFGHGIGIRTNADVTPGPSDAAEPDFDVTERQPGRAWQIRLKTLVIRLRRVERRRTI